MSTNKDLPSLDPKSNPIGDGRWGVILLAHGSQRGADRSECSCFWQSSNPGPPAWCPGCPNTPDGLKDAAQRLQVSLGRDRAEVILSCLEFIEPHPDQAVRIIREQGLKRVVIAPFLLGNGKHATLELDEVLEELQSQEPSLELHLAQGLGTEFGLANLVAHRIRSLPAANPIKSDEASPTGIIMVKAGTKTEYDDCLWLEELGRLVESELGPGFAVAVAQSHYGDPTMESAAEHLIQGRGASRLIAMPYLFFPGMILKRNVLGEMDRLQEAYPNIPMGITPPLGMDDRVIKVAEMRVREVWKRIGLSES